MICSSISMPAVCRLCRVCRPLARLGSVIEAARRGIKFIPFVCPSSIPTTTQHARSRSPRIGVRDGQTNGIKFIPFVCLSRRFLLPISSRQIDESISIADFFPPNRRARPPPIHALPLPLPLGSYLPPAIPLAAPAPTRYL
jgi:hypothetical protein